MSSCIKSVSEAKSDVDEMWEKIKLRRARDIFYKQNKVNSQGLRWIVWWEKLFGEDYTNYVWSRIHEEERKAKERRNQRRQEVDA